MPVVVVFSSRRTDHHVDEYGSMSARMADLAREQPGFISITSVRDPATREGITVAFFDDDESVRQWKAHVEHQEAQRRGITDFYEEYRVTVATVQRDYSWSADR